MSNLDDLREASRLSPDNVPLLLLLGQACFDAFLVDEAQQAYEHALTVDPRQRTAQIGLARVHYLRGRASEAAVRLEALLNEDPDDTRALLLMCRILIGDGNLEQARTSYRRAVELDPSVRDGELERDLGPGEPPPTRPATRVRAGSDVDVELETRDVAPPSEPERPTLTFESVGGMDEIKEEIRLKIIYPLQQPDLYRAYGKQTGGGVLLYGPPGCGKTLISRATAGELKAAFFAVGLHDVLDMYLGNSERNLHALFETARANAPCVLFLDEVDALAANRADLRRSAGRTLVNQFLADLDGSGQNEGVLVLGATNAPWHLDSAFLRPGRFDRVIFVQPPDETARLAIIEIHARNRPVSDLDPRSLARRTKGFSGADLASVFDRATEACLQEAMKQRRVVPVTGRALQQAAEKTRPSAQAWFETAKNYALYSNQSGMYDPILEYLGIRK